MFVIVSPVASPPVQVRLESSASFNAYNIVAFEDSI